MQVGVKWMSISELKNLRFYPKPLLDYLDSGTRDTSHISWEILPDRVTGDVKHEH